MIVIVGGGLSGLSLAFHLQKAGVDYCLYEKAPIPGGCLKSVQIKDYLLENGPNTLLCDEVIMNLIKELDLDDQLVYPSSENKNRFVFKNNSYQKLPSGPKDLLFENFFSFSTKIKIIKELFRKKGASHTTTLEEFFMEHFGKEVSDYALNPFVSGIYAGDPHKLLIDETFPVLRKYEIENGSILKGIIKNAGKRKTTVNFKSGMQALPFKMAENLNIKYNSVVKKLEKVDGKFNITISTSGPSFTMTADVVVLCLPAFEMVQVLSEEFVELGNALKNINYPPMSIVHSAFKKEDVSFPLNGFGGLNPKIANKFSAGSIWTSTIFPERTKEQTILFTTFVGGAQYKENAELGESEVKQRVNDELKSDFKIKSNAIFQHYYFWQKSIPQYDESMRKARSLLEEYENENLYVCSNIFDGISMPDCIKKGKTLAKKLSKLSEN